MFKRVRPLEYYIEKFLKLQNKYSKFPIIETFYNSELSTYLISSIDVYIKYVKQLYKASSVDTLKEIFDTQIDFIPPRRLRELHDGLDTYVIKSMRINRLFMLAYKNKMRMLQRYPYGIEYAQNDVKSSDHLSILQDLCSYILDSDDIEYINSIISDMRDEAKNLKFVISEINKYMFSSNITDYLINPVDRIITEMNEISDIAEERISTLENNNNKEE